MKTLIHKILYRTLPLEGYLRAVSRLFFLWQRLGIGRYAPATEYVYHLPELVRAGDTAIDIGALVRTGVCHVEKKTLSGSGNVLHARGLYQTAEN